ncbi:MAG: serine/threonine-protein kinase [Polyangiaceae bacterium]
MTPASRIKALVLSLELAKGGDASSALLQKLKLSRDDLDNETRPIAIALWHNAVREFVEVMGRDGLDEIWRGVVHPSNLAVWARVLRATASPEDAFRQLDALGVDGARSTRWETVSSEPGRWRGRLFVAHDPLFERDGLLSAARAGEMRAIPMMFGLPLADVRVSSLDSGTLISRSGVATQEFEAEWSHKLLPAWLPFCSVFGMLGAAAGSVTTQGIMAAAGLVGGVGFGAASAYGWYREQLRRAESSSQGIRLGALERSMLHREQSGSPQGYETGTVIAGMYRLGPRLGTGASGVIHEATRLSDNVPVAIKLLRAAVAHDAVSSDRLRREAEAMGLAWHPGVVELYDQGVLPDGTNYLAMELLRGESLASKLKRVRSLSPPEVVRIASEILDALSAIHAAGVIHRDLKPSNIFLVDSEPGGSEKIKILDFGIARVEWAETRLTMMGAAVGTPGYMSPEQEQGGEVDARSDLFSLGAVLYECLTGNALTRPMASPMRDAKPAEPFSGVHKAALPPGWGEVIEKAMALSPRERFPDAKTMRDAILSKVSTEFEEPSATARGA